MTKRQQSPERHHRLRDRRGPGQRPAEKPRPSRRPSPGQTHWGDVAEWYDRLVGDEGSEYHQHVVIPGVLRMLGTTTAKSEKRDAKLRVLDLACGQGVLCRRLAQEGHELTGVDAAAELIEAARRRNEAEGLAIRYIVADVTKLIDEQGHLQDGLAPETYDAVTVVLAIQNITPLSPVWQACRGALKPGGHLIVVMMHPCFRVPKRSDWHWDDASETQSRLVSQYLSSSNEEILIHPGLAAYGKDESVTLHFHRPLQAYVNTLGNAGLLIDHVEEWTSHKTSPPGPRKAAIDRARKEIPMFLALRARKV